MKRIVFALLVASAAKVAIPAAQGERVLAEELWNQAVSAKGGRGKLGQVRSLVVTEKTTYTNNKLDPGFTRQRLYAFPSGIWEFVDHRPGKLGFGLGVVLDLERPLQWGSSGSSPARQGWIDDATYNLLEGQFLFLLETAFLKPVPLRVRSGTARRSGVDILETKLPSDVRFPYHSEVRVEYHIDRQIHLPILVVTHHSVRVPPGERLAPRTFEHEDRYVLGNYINVDGLLMPAVVMTEARNKTNTTSYRFNVDYDERVFTTRPQGRGALNEWEKK